MKHESQIYKIIENQFENYDQRVIDELVSHKALSNEELHQLRGRSRGCRDLLRILRSNLGYDPAQL